MKLEPWLLFTEHLYALHLDESQTRGAFFGCPWFSSHPTLRLYLASHQKPPTKDPDAQDINGKLIPCYRFPKEMGGKASHHSLYRRHMNSLFFSQHPSLTMACLLPRLSPFPAWPWPWPLQARFVAPHDLIPAFGLWTPLIPAGTRWNSAVLQAYAWGSGQGGAPSLPSLNPKMLIKEFCCLWLNSSRIHQTKQASRGKAEGEAGKRFCTEDTRFSKDMVKAEGTARGKRVFLPAPHNLELQHHP